MKIEDTRFPSVSGTLQALIAPIIVILLIFAGVALTLILSGTLSQDRAEVARSQQTAAAALRAVARNLRIMVADHSRGTALPGQAGGADSVAEHAAARFGPSVHSAFGQVHALVFDGRGGVLYADDARYGREADRFGDLLAAVPAQAAEAGGIASGFVAVGGTIHVAAAKAMSTIGTPGAGQAVLVMLQPLDRTLLRHLETDFQLRDLAVSETADVGTRSGIFIFGLKGETLGVLAWASERPGSELLKSIAVPIILAALLAGLLLSFFLRTAVRTTRAIRLGNEALEESGLALEHSETKLQTIIDGVADAILSIDEQGIIISANEAARDIFGYELDDLVGSESSLLFTNNDADAPAGDDAAISATRMMRADASVETTQYHELTAFRRDGTRIIVDAAISHLNYYNTAVAIAVIRDVTERRQAEETLNLLSTGMILVTRDCRLLMANHSASRILDRGEGLSLLGGTVSAQRRQDAEHLRELVQNACGGAKDRGLESVMSIDRGVDVRPLSLMVAPLQLAQRTDRSSAAVIFIRDLEVRQSVPPEILGKLFGLTPAEARVVGELVKGKRLQEVAADLGVSLNTVRNQLKQIFGKTNTGRQSELISLVLSGTAFLSGQEMVAEEAQEVHA